MTVSKNEKKQRIQCAHQSGVCSGVDMVLQVACTMSAIAVAEIFHLQNNAWVRGAALYHAVNLCTIMNFLALFATVYDTASLKIRRSTDTSLWILLCQVRLFLYMWRFLGLRGLCAGYTCMFVASMCCCGRPAHGMQRWVQNAVRLHWTVWVVAILLNHRLSHLLLTVAVANAPTLRAFEFHRRCCILLCFLNLYT